MCFCGLRYQVMAKKDRHTICAAARLLDQATPGTFHTSRAHLCAFAFRVADTRCQGCRPFVNSTSAAVFDPEGRWSRERRIAQGRPVLCTYDSRRAQVAVTHVRRCPQSNMQALVSQEGCESFPPPTNLATFRRRVSLAAVFTVLIYRMHS
jgi:hypothetical protein